MPTQRSGSAICQVPEKQKIKSCLKKEVVVMTGNPKLKCPSCETDGLSIHESRPWILAEDKLFGTSDPFGICVACGRGCDIENGVPIRYWWNDPISPEQLKVIIEKNDAEREKLRAKRIEKIRARNEPVKECPYCTNGTVSAQIYNSYSVISTYTHMPTKFIGICSDCQRTFKTDVLGHHCYLN